MYCIFFLKDLCDLFFFFKDVNEIFETLNSFGYAWSLKKSFIRQDITLRRHATRAAEAGVGEGGRGGNEKACWTDSL